MNVKVALSSADGFVAPYIMEMLGDSLVEIPDDKLDDPASLDALLTPCNTLIHINSRPVDSSVARDDRESYIIMREKARPILDAVDRHGSLHDHYWDPESAPPMGAWRRVLRLRFHLSP